MYQFTFVQFYLNMRDYFQAFFGQFIIKKKKIGSTVHYMDDKIDNGAILGQVKTYMPDNPTMYNVIKITKESVEISCARLLKK